MTVTSNKVLYENKSFYNVFCQKDSTAACLNEESQFLSISQSLPCVSTYVLIVWCDMLTFVSVLFCSGRWSPSGDLWQIQRSTTSDSWRGYTFHYPVGPAANYLRHPKPAAQCANDHWQQRSVILLCTAYTHPFNSPLSRTTRVSRYQKGITNLDFTEARDSEWQWHQLGHMQVCTSREADNHASTPPLSFYRPDDLPAAQPTASKHWRWLL